MLKTPYALLVCAAVGSSQLHATIGTGSISSIAAGDVTNSTAVLWGKTDLPGNLTFEIATDASFNNVIHTQQTTVVDSDVPGKVTASNLEAGTTYYYRVSHIGGANAEGRFATLASLDGGNQGVSFGVSGDWRGELAPYPAISNADEVGLDFFVSLGDTIYADYPSPAVPAAQAMTIGEYRAKHHEVYSARFGLNTLDDLRCSTSIFANIDDHEVINDFAGGAPASSDPRFGTSTGLISETPLYNTGLQAFNEYNPIELSTYSGTGDARFDGKPKLYRSRDLGKDGKFIMLDARSFRDSELPEPSDITNPQQVGAFLVQSFDFNPLTGEPLPRRTMLGAVQLADLKADLLKAHVAGQTWKFIMVPEPIQNFGPLGAADRFEGYAAERTELLKFIDDNGIQNVVFVCADIHGTVVNNLTYQLGPGQAQIPTSAFEISTGSVAFDAPFGQTVAQLTQAAGLMDAQTAATYNSLPTAPDADSIPNDKDDLIKSVVNTFLTEIGYDPIGLSENLSIADGLIDAELLVGDYFATHTYGWTQFNVDPTTQELTVTTYGIEPYTQSEMEADSADISSRTPTVVSQFKVAPQPAKATANHLASITLTGAEIPAYDPISKRAFASTGSGVEVVDLSDPANPVQLPKIDLTTLGFTSNNTSSINVKNGLLAVGIIASPKTTNGTLAILNAANGTLVGSAEVGPNPDHVTFTPDGSKVLVCNEGETAGDPMNDTTPGGVSIVTVSDFSVQTAGFAAFNSQATTLKAAGVRIYEGATPEFDFEPEYLAISPDGSTAFVTLQEANAIGVLDIANATFTEIVPLGEKDFSTLMADLSDRNGSGFNPTSGNPVFGAYMPDAIASFQSDGQTYYVIANEGDDRDDFLTNSETSRVAALTLDPTAFPNADTLKANANLGRLNVLTTPFVNGDLDNDGDIDRLTMLGGRSFSILDSTGQIVYDSGDILETINGNSFPTNFDDGRSDNKGPEPEGVAVAQFGTCTLAFIGLERSNMVMIFDITNPLAPYYVDSLLNAGDISPEGIWPIPASQSPNGKPLVLIANEVSNTLAVYELDGLVSETYQLELFHFSDQEATAATVEDAPRFSAVLNKLRDQDLNNDGEPDNSLTLTSGDSILGGLFYDVAQEVYGSRGIADMQILNELGIQAIGFGNHEFDFGTTAIANLISGDAIGNILGSDFTGANFPYLSGNIDFTTDTAMAPLVTADHAAPAANKVAATIVIDVNGEKIGVVAATTPTLRRISSPGTLDVFPSTFAGTPSPDELDALAAIIQQDVDALLASDSTIDKVILLTHMQQISIEQALATRLRNVDIIVAGGSNTRLFDSNDRIRPGDTNQGVYPIVSNDANGQPIAIVNTDGSYKYVGRLVINFDTNGQIIPASYDETISGAYATDAQGVNDLAAASFVDPEIQTIANEMRARIIATDGNFFGVTTEFLNGNRSGGPTDGVRTQETNLGNLTADANLAYAKAIDPTVVLSLKNGGGIRASIGETAVLSGETTATRIPPRANPLSGRPVGGISQNLIQTALAFNNSLSLVTVTRSELVALLEHGVSATTATNAPGQFPQVSGVEFSYDISLPANNRLLSAALVDEQGKPTDILVSNGEIVGNPTETFRMVTLGYLVDGGDGYPFPTGPASDRVNLAKSDIDPKTGGATFAPDGTEQDAFAEYLLANFPATSPYSEADGPRESDERIQNLDFRMDNVLLGLDLVTFANTYNLDPTANDTIMAYAYGLDPNQVGELVLDTTGNVISRGTQAFSIEIAPNQVDLTLTFLRRKDAAAQGLTYTLEYSADLQTWFTVNEAPAVVGMDGEMEVVRGSLPIFTPNLEKARFFRVSVDAN